MRSLLPIRWLFALLLSISSLSAAWASHLRGFDLSYASIAPTTLGVPRYHLVVRQFVEPNTTWIVNTVTVTASQGGACYTASPNAFSISFGANGNPTDGPSALCGVTGLGTPAYRVYTYEHDIDLPPGQWWLSTSLGERQPDIQNIPNSIAQPTYISAYIDNRTGILDASPKFESVVQNMISPAAVTPFSSSAFDTDGDSLRYELIIPFMNCTQPTPGTLTPHFNLQTGSGAFLPTSPTASGTGQGYYDVTVQISEYRHIGARWALIGYVMRDSQYLLFPSTNLPPTFTTMQVNGGAAQLPSQNIAIQPGQTVNVQLQASDPDVSQLLRFASDAPTAVPGLSVARVGTTNSVLLTWQVPATLLPGRYYIPVAVFDNGCPFNASEERTLAFVVSNAALATRASAAATEVYPTPFHDQVQFKTGPNQGVVLFDALGREVARLTSQADGLVRWQPATTLPAGLYFARSAADGQPLARLLRAE